MLTSIGLVRTIFLDVDDLTKSGNASEKAINSGVKKEEIARLKRSAYTINTYLKLLTSFCLFFFLFGLCLKVRTKISICSTIPQIE